MAPNSLEDLLGQALPDETTGTQTGGIRKRKKRVPRNRAFINSRKVRMQRARMNKAA